jgi:succinate dehydrogenase/fumarate reductase cytochrome b subunit
MTTQPAPTPLNPDRAIDALSPTWQRRLALSGVAFAPFFVIGWVTSVANNPHYTASDQAWTNWAHDNQTKGRISAFAMLLAAFLFLHFIAAIRSALEDAESSVGGSATRRSRRPSISTCGTTSRRPSAQPRRRSLLSSMVGSSFAERGPSGPLTA